MLERPEVQLVIKSSKFFLYQPSVEMLDGNRQVS